MEGIKAVDNKIAIKRAMFIADVGTFAKTLQYSVSSNLQALLGDSMKHFQVTINGNQYAYSISVKAIDDIGQYIYYGTREHDETGDPLASPGEPVGGLGHPIYGTVHHPAVEGRKPEIDEAVHSALREALVIFK